MTLKEAYKLYSKKEGKKKNLSHGEIREQVGVFADMITESPELIGLLQALGAKRKKRKK